MTQSLNCCGLKTGSLDTTRSVDACFRPPNAFVGLKTNTISRQFPILSESFRICCSSGAAKLENQLTSDGGKLDERRSARQSCRNCRLRTADEPTENANSKEIPLKDFCLMNGKGKVWKQRPASFSVCLSW
jgi:hypothetical protein